MRHFTLVLLLLFSLSVSSQTIGAKWAVQKTAPAPSKGLICDKDSNIVSFGNRFPDDMNPFDSGYDNQLADTTGSYFQRFNPSGQLMFTKRWYGISFFIESMIYDGDESYYFTGAFQDDITVDGISLNARGKGDGMVGKMDGNGMIQWISTFGAGKEERGEGICFDAAKSKLIVTGCTMDSLYVNNVFVDEGQQSTLLAVFDLSGNYLSHRLIDFLPERDDQSWGNFGKEIISDNSGNFYLLADRQGSHWGGDTVVAPEDGRYIMKLNYNYDTLWTKYIIGPACYYGFAAHSMRSTPSNGVVVMSFCSAHYGGDAYLYDVNSPNGTFGWTQTNDDGAYRDMFVDQSGGIWIAGSDSAIFAPGPNDYAGNQLIRKLDASGAALDSFKIFSEFAKTSDIVKVPGGPIYIAGTFNNRPNVVIGSDTVYADGSAGNYYNTYFLARLEEGMNTASIAEAAHKSSLLFYPNPSSAEIRIERLKSITATLRIYNALSQCVKCFVMKEDNSINVKDLPEGIYMLTLEQDSKLTSGKMVIHH